MSDFTLTVEPRTETGTSHMRRLRRLSGKVPAVIYGAEKEPQHVMITSNAIQKALETEAFASSILTLDVGGDKQKVILKEVHRHPWKARVLHLDFFRISAKEKITMTIPIHFTGEEECIGVKEKGCIVSHHINELEIRCLPADLPEFIEIDISKLDQDDVIHLTGIKLPKGVELMALAHGADQAHDHVVVSVHEKVIIEEPEEEVVEAAEEGAEAAEGEAAAEGGEEQPPAEGEEAGGDKE